MKLTLIITGLRTGGAETMLLKVLKRLDRNQFVPHVISLTTIGEVGPKIIDLGITVDALGMKPGMSFIMGFVRMIGLLRHMRPDVVHTWMYHSDLLGGVAARLAGVPAVGWSIRHSSLSDSESKFTTRIAAKACASISRWVPDRILCCSNVARHVHAGIGYADEKMVVIPNGFDLEHFKPNQSDRISVREELGVCPETPLVGMIGRYDPQKNHSGFFKAAALLHRRLPDVNFMLAGKGVDEGNHELAMMVQSAGLMKTTHLLGLRNDMPRLMASLDVLVLSSSYGEGFPNVLGEAMSCGVPCAVTDVGDSAYIVGDTGRVVGPRDMDGLAAAMESLLSLGKSERHSLGLLARARVEKCFEIGAVVRKFEAFYKALSERHA